MHGLGRMPIWASIDPIRKQWLTWLLILNAVYGAVNLFGRAKPELLVVPIVGTALLLIAIVAIGFGWSVIGAAVGTFAWSAFLFASLTSITSGVTTSYGDLVLALGMGGWHVLVLYEVGTGLDVEREIKARS